VWVVRGRADSIPRFRNMPNFLRNQTKHREITNKSTILTAIKHNTEKRQKEKLKREIVLTAE
jgi:hypothetical protein